MEEQPNEGKPTKEAESGSGYSNSKTPVATEKKKSWYSFASGKKKVE